MLLNVYLYLSSVAAFLLAAVAFFRLGGKEGPLLGGTYPVVPTTVERVMRPAHLTSTIRQNINANYAVRVQVLNV